MRTNNNHSSGKDEQDVEEIYRQFNPESKREMKVEVTIIDIVRKPEYREEMEVEI